MKRTIVMISTLWIAGLFIQVCASDTEEPAPVTLGVSTDKTHIVTVTNDEGWSVSLDEFQLAVKDLEFTTGGETHARKPPAAWLISSAHAHPGHAAGGEVIGELSKKILFDMNQAPASVGKASLLPGDYNGMNLHFRNADEADGLDDDAPILGHAAYLSGTATKDDTSIEFEAFLDIAPKSEMIGGPFTAQIDSSSSGTISLQFFTKDPAEGDTLFDGLAFDELDEDGDQQVTIADGDIAHNILSKTIQRHDHYGMTFKQK